MTNVKTEVEAESFEAHDLAGIAIAAATEAIDSYQKEYGLCEAPFRVVLSVDNEDGVEGTFDYPVESGPDRMSDLLSISGNGWVPHDSAECPVHPMDIVETYQGNYLSATPAKGLFWEVVTSYRPLRDEDGVSYCSAEGLEDWAEYVATDQDGEEFQFEVKPELCKDYWYTTGCYDAPNYFANTSDHWTETLRRVWRK